MTDVQLLALVLSLTAIGLAIGRVASAIYELARQIRALR